MTPEFSHTVAVTSVTNVTEKNLQQISPIISAYVLSIIGYVNGFLLTTFVGVLGVFTNTANICVYLKMGLSETTNINFFSLSISDLLVSLSAVLVQLTYNPPVSVMTLPSGAPVSEIGMAACFMFPSMGCSAWITAVLSVERCLCISTPLKVKEIFTPKRTVFLVLAMVIYQSVLIVLLYSYPGPPYDVPNSARRSRYITSSFTALSCICFFVVLISTVLLVVRLMQNLEWRNKAAKQSNKNSGSRKETKAARCVAAICFIFILCFAPNVALNFANFASLQFGSNDLYLQNLMIVFYSISTMLQVLSSAVNIFVYYRMSTKYREVFKVMFHRK